MIRAVFFDAVGTLLEPTPTAVEVYHDVGRRLGSRLAPEEIAVRFRAAFRQQERLDQDHHWRTDEVREERRWRAIVAAVLDDVADQESCFRTLWDHFARPTAWRCLDGVAELFAELDRRGLVLGMASNFDARLRGVVAGLPELGLLRHLVISSEVGWRKPAPEFFREVVARAAVAPAHILFVGDDPINDDEGARRAGLTALRLAPDGTLRCLRDLTTLLR